MLDGSLLPRRKQKLVSSTNGPPSEVLNAIHGEGSQSNAPSSQRWMQTEDGWLELQGMREGEWLKNWESSIKVWVERRVRDDGVITAPLHDVLDTLDGYRAR